MFVDIRQKRRHCERCLLLASDTAISVKRVNLRAQSKAVNLELGQLGESTRIRNKQYFSDDRTNYNRQPTTSQMESFMTHWSLVSVLNPTS